MIDDLIRRKELLKKVEESLKQNPHEDPNTFMNHIREHHHFINLIQHMPPAYNAVSPLKIYISGPITGIEGYMKRFDETERLLTSKGFTVINPAKVNAQLPGNTTHEEYMKTSIAMLDMCDTIYMMKGWEKSKGCSIEFEYAYEHGITITFEGGWNGCCEQANEDI
jgi:hypothetical protein